MKRLSMILSLVLALCMILSMGAFASGEASGETSAEAQADTKSVEEAYLAYAREFLQNELLVNSYMTQEQIDNEFMPLVEAHDYETFPAYNMYHDGWFVNGRAMTFEEFEAQYQPGGETKSVEDAFIDYIHDWLYDELAINSLMSEDIIENEYMPEVRAFDFVSFPAEMLYNGMLEQGCPMTFEEFAAQYQAAAGGDVTWQDYIDFLWNSFKDTAPDPDALKTLLDSTPDWAFIEENIESGPWYKFFGEDYYNATTWDEFAANGGVGTFNADFVDSAGGAS